MIEFLKCILISIIIDVVFFGCGLILLQIAEKSTLAIVTILLFAMFFCTYKAVRGYRKIDRSKKPFSGAGTYVPKGAGD